MLASNSHWIVTPILNGLTRIYFYITPVNPFQPSVDLDGDGDPDSGGIGGTVDVDNPTDPPPIEIGVDTSRVWLTLNRSQTQFVRVQVLVGPVATAVDVSTGLVGDVQISWPDESGGSALFRLRGRNPFVSEAVINVEELVNIKAFYFDSVGATHVVQLFKGRIVQFDYSPDDDLTEVSVQDMSRDVSHDTSRLNTEILGVDPLATDVVTCTKANVLVVNSDIDMDQPLPVLGIWDEADTSLTVNLADAGDFTIGTDNRTITFFQTGIINVNTNYRVRYAVPTSQFDVPQLAKSQVVKLITTLAGIESVVMEREGLTEDEIVNVNITANNELPLDMIRKIVVPQTWKVEYNESGDLVIRREILKTASTADFSFDETVILDGTLRIMKDIDSVINEIRVAGILKRLGSDNVSRGTF